MTYVLFTCYWRSIWQYWTEPYCQILQGKTILALPYTEQQGIQVKQYWLALPYCLGHYLGQQSQCEGCLSILVTIFQIKIVRTYFNNICFLFISHYVFFFFIILFYILSNKRCITSVKITPRSILAPTSKFLMLLPFKLLPWKLIFFNFLMTKYIVFQKNIPYNQGDKIWLT